MGLMSGAMVRPDIEQLWLNYEFCPQRAIAFTKQAMPLHPQNVDIQLAGIESLRDLVHTSYDNLFAFASCGGLEIVEQAMLRHPENVDIQCQCIRTLSRGGDWSNEI